MDLKLYIDLHSMLKNKLQKKKFKVFIKRQFNYESKYNAKLFITSIFLYVNKRSYHKNDDP